MNTSASGISTGIFISTLEMNVTSAGPITEVGETEVVTQTTLKNIAEENQGPLDASFIPWDNPDNMITRETQEAISSVLQAGCIPVLFCLGATGNMLTLLVFARQGLRDHVNLLFFSLALTDFVYLIGGVFPGLRSMALLIDSTATLVPSYFNPELLWISSTLHLLSSLLLALISLSRCLTIMMPLRFSGFSWQQTLCAIFVVLIISILVHIPRFLMYKTVYLLNPTTNLTIYVHGDTALAPAIRQALPKILFDLDVIILKPAYVGLVLVCSIITSVKVRQASKMRSLLTTGNAVGKSWQNETRITKMLLLICLTFLLCTLPDAVLLTFTYVKPTFTFYGRQHNAYTLTYHANIVAKHFNATANFFIFLVMGSRFRSTLSEILPCLAAAQRRFKFFGRRAPPVTTAAATGTMATRTVESEFSQDPSSK